MMDRNPRNPHTDQTRTQNPHQMQAQMILRLMLLVALTACACSDEDPNDSTPFQSDAPDTRTPPDVSNTAACRLRCQDLPHVERAICDNDQCTTIFCDAGFEDCDQNPDNGCEVDLSTNPKHCGACGFNCATIEHVGSVSCEARTCVINACAQRFADCDQNLANGCETHSAQPEFCNASQSCGGPADPSLVTFSADGERASAPAEFFIDCTDPASFGAPPDSNWTCQTSPNGAAFDCIKNYCPPDFAACDPENPTRCDTLDASPNCVFCGNTCADGARCSGGLVGDGCVCGASGERCGASGDHYRSATCAGDDCMLHCNPGWGDCDGDSDNGCEVNLETNTQHCGACEQPCALTAQAETVGCVAAQCAINTCADNYADCDGNPDNGCEAIPSQNDRCNTSPACQPISNASEVTITEDGGRASPPPGLYLDCTNPASFGGDPAALWSCQNTPDSDGYSCVLNRCDEGFSACDPSQPTRCNALYSMLHCGRCGNACATRSICTGPTPGDDCRCAADTSNGEICHQTGPNFGSAICQEGECVLDCDQGFVDCDSDPLNGCETQSTDQTCP